MERAKVRSYGKSHHQQSGSRFQPTHSCPGNTTSEVS
jgi:hypothetical protein